MKSVSVSVGIEGWHSLSRVEASVSSSRLISSAVPKPRVMACSARDRVGFGPLRDS